MEGSYHSQLRRPQHTTLFFMLCTTLTTVMDEALQPVIAAGPIDSCSLILDSICCFRSTWWHVQSLLLEVLPKLRSQLSLAITTTATYQTCLTLPTTHTAVMDAALTPFIAGGSIYRRARILQSHDICLKVLFEMFVFASGLACMRIGPVSYGSLTLFV